MKIKNRVILTLNLLQHTYLCKSDNSESYINQYTRIFDYKNG